MAGLLSAFSGDWEIHPKSAEMIIAPIDEDGNIDAELGGGRVLQYWPESIEDQFSANWQEKSIPGSPVPMYQWISGGARAFTCTAMFSRDMDGKINEDIEEDKFNVDVDAAVAWLRMFCLSDYQDRGDVLGAAVAPPVLWVLPTGTKMNYNMAAGSALKTNNNKDGIYCLLLDVSVTRDNWFRTGTVRHATVALNFAETIQVGKHILPYGRSDMKRLADGYGRRVK